MIFTEIQLNPLISAQIQLQVKLNISGYPITGFLFSILLTDLYLQFFTSRPLSPTFIIKIRSLTLISNNISLVRKPKARILTPTSSWVLCSISQCELRFLQYNKRFHTCSENQHQWVLTSCSHWGKVWHAWLTSTALGICADVTRWFKFCEVTRLVVFSRKQNLAFVQMHSFSIPYWR